MHNCDSIGLAPQAELPGHIGHRMIVRCGCIRRIGEERATRAGMNGRVQSRDEVESVYYAEGGCRLTGGQGLEHQPHPKCLRSGREPTLEQIADESAQIVAKNQQDREQDNRYKNQQERIFDKTLTAAT